MNPFLIDGPAIVSLSGGRTSAYMLRRILDAGLRPDVHVVFCNTGKEDEATLAFVDRLARAWGVSVAWLEYRREREPHYRSPDVARIARRFRDARGRGALAPGPERGFREVDFGTASRRGEPFENYVGMSGTPNPSIRTCTTELKIRPMKRWMIERGYERWDMVVGIRADEPARVAKLRRSPPERWEHAMPLADAGIVEADVLAFWRGHPLDLELPVDPELGTYLGNCDGCWLKSVDKLQRIEREHPGRLAWWEDVERDAGSPFRRERHGYARLRVLAAEGAPTSAGSDDLGDCICHD